MNKKIFIIMLLLFSCNKINDESKIKKDETCITGFITNLNDSYHSMKIEGKLIDCDDINK